MKVIVESIETKGENLFVVGNLKAYQVYGYLIDADVYFELGPSFKGRFYFPGEQEMSFSKAEKKIRELFTEQKGD
ncbi:MULTISPECIES: hypothetical protein [Bacillus]|uniref:Uncharacterized protein n=1 Tax=Bacillus glycinifermentans TaxID=1664069 RepID=A0AAJ3Z1K6_9BACI|nr:MULTISPECIES: hypothetical protein [Bacillus]KKB75339.1 hypothetical protein TH62_01865 [Bacillus sp. TH008]MDU0070678.1 hypothetical protein [Bacillus sp. IG6]MED8018542.1 hypothetical protein [Bacillus glycinifermentans]QAT66993.1 hypothetical protein EQZ20_20345 [Bacillus glycinifermentans]WKB76705.1 hypothetical protein QYM22_20505 [Bacillus glycinifermentans]